MNKLFLIAVLLSSPAWAVITTVGALVSGTTATFGSSLATSSPMNVVAGNLVVCHVSFDGGGSTISGVTDGGSNAMTGLHLSQFNGSSSHGQIWYKANAVANAAATFTMSSGGGWTNYAALTCRQYHGVLTAAPVDVDDTSDTGNGNGNSTTTATISTSVAGELIVTAQALDRAGTTALTTAGYTLVGSDTGQRSNFGEKITTGTVSSESTAWTFTNGPWHGPSIATFKAAPSTSFSGDTIKGVPNQSLIQGLYGGGISLTGQTAAITTATLCDIYSCTAGQYRITANLASSLVCATPGPGAIGVALTWTDSVGTKSAQTLPLDDNNATTFSTTMALGDATTYASGSMTLWSTGANPIQYATVYTACTTGTGTYTLRIGVERLQ